MNIRIYGLNKWFHIAESHVLRQVNLGIFSHIFAMAYLKKPLGKLLGIGWSSIKSHVLAEKEDFDVFPKVWTLNGCMHNVFMWIFKYLYNRKVLEKVATKYDSNACERSIIITDIMQGPINSINCVVVLRLWSFSWQFEIMSVKATEILLSYFKTSDFLYSVVNFIQNTKNTL